MMVAMSSPRGGGASEAVLQACRGHVDVVLALPHEVEVEAVPVGADLPVARERIRGADAVGAFEVRLLARGDTRRRIRRDVGAAVRAAALGEDVEAIADGHAEREADVRGERL